MKKTSTLKRASALLMALALCLSIPLAASAATVADATIDTTETGSLTIYKYDLTNSQIDGVWDNSYVSTGVEDHEGVNEVLGDSDVNNLGNSETSNGYAIKGVEFTYLKVADIVQFSESSTDNQSYNHVMVLYAIDKTVGADFLAALGLANGENRYENADSLDSTKYYYQSDVLIDALDAALKANSTVVKNALENYVAAQNSTAMPLTDANGKTGANDLALGLYLMVETKVPEQVVSTTDPFLVSIPMTSVNGDNATDGGTRWIYDVTVYPKNLTGIPSLEKTLRETKDDTGLNNDSDVITDGYKHTATASSGDVIDYQIISTLPAITSEATYLSEYTFVDTLSTGLTYNKEDVVLEFFTDEACTGSIASWSETSGNFTVEYTTADNGASVMTIKMTEQGLAEINSAETVYTAEDAVNSGYSDCTLRITYQATVDSDNTVVFGDNGNPNNVVMTWRRTSSNYYDTLVDDCHLYTYGIELTKEFSDNNGNFSKVEFIIQNETDGYFVKAELNEEEGVYYVVDHVADEAAATHFVPIDTGVIMVKGLEDDTYILTEVQTDDAYTLLKEDITVVISTAETTELCDIYESDVVGLLQNDPRYTEEIIEKAIAEGYITEDGDLADILNNMPQTHLEHALLTASATLDGNDVTMLEDNSSVNAEAPLTVTNTRGFDLPGTGDLGTFIISSVGIFSAAVVVFMIVLAAKKKKEQTA